MTRTSWLYWVPFMLAAVAVGCGDSDDERCTKNTDCEDYQICNLSNGKCETYDCTPDCVGKCCGSDGCDSICPNNCTAGSVCNLETCECDPCIPDCSSIECGPDPVCGEICGPCTDGFTCVDGQCVCQPDCDNLECGEDPVCGQSCGTCEFNSFCSNGECWSNVETDFCIWGEYCDRLDSECITHGGFTFCSIRCDSQEDCNGPPYCCFAIDQESYCFPDYLCPLSGDGQAGEPCPFDGLHGDADYCLEELTCLGTVASGNWGTCTTGEDCIDAIGESWNPDCLEGLCGGSFCAAECGENRACPGNYHDQDVVGTCFCIPVM